MKNKDNLFGAYLTDILREMCRRVGVDYGETDFTKDQWYLDHSWSQKEEEKFVEWFAQHLRNIGPRKELCNYPSLVRTKPQRVKFARSFVNEFGWKTI